MRDTSSDPKFEKKNLKSLKDEKPITKFNVMNTGQRKQVTLNSQSKLPTSLQFSTLRAPDSINQFKNNDNTPRDYSRVSMELNPHVPNKTS